LVPRKAAAFLGKGFVLLPVVVVCVETLGVQTTNDESDLSFLLVTGNATDSATSGASTFLFLYGKILDLTSCKLWSGLFTIYQCMHIERFKHKNLIFLPKFAGPLQLIIYILHVYV
jgi:hypothetical protein